MSVPSNQDPRLDQSAASDASLLAAHEKLLGKQPDEKAHYSLMPLALLFGFSGLIFWAGTYLNRYSGQFDAKIFDENAHPHSGAAEVVKVDPVQLGKKIFNTPGMCVTCHMPTGLGVPGSFPPLAGSEWVSGSEERVIRIVLRGLKGPITVKGVTYSAAPMPAFGPGTGYNLNDEKIAAVLTYVRQEWDNKAGPISAEKVAEIRSKEANLKETTVEELMKLP